MAEQVEHAGEFDRVVARWREELDIYGKEYSLWERSAENIEKRYALKGYTDGQPRLNLLWSNVQTLQPALYSKTPEPVAQRRFKDRNPIARLGSQVIERFLKNDLMEDPIDEVFSSCVMDMLLVGRGVPWVSYEAELATVDGVQRVASERARVEYVAWRDFAHSQGKTWADIRSKGWVARREYLTRRQGKERFGDAFEKVPLNARSTVTSDNESPIASLMKMAEIWEIWDAQDKVVYWICRDHEEPLDVKPDPWGLKHFFPCPQPLYSGTCTNGMIPIPDYEQYRPLAQELDLITRRISILTASLRVAGVYDASLPNLGQALLDDGDVNKLIPVPGINEYKSTRGAEMSDVIKFMPIQTIAEVLTYLYAARDQVKALCYEITGISDIIRGDVDHREKAAQSQIKSEWAASRIDPRRAEVARMCRDVIAMKGELMCEHFQPERLRLMSDFDNLPEVQEMAKAGGPQFTEQAWMQIMGMIRDEHMRSYQIEIETDSTVLSNSAVSQENAISYLQATAGLLDRIGPAIQVVPELAGILAEQLLFVSRRFRPGRSLESHLEELVDTLEERAQQPPPPDPAMQQAQAELEMKAQEAQIQIESKRQDMEMKAQAGQTDLGMKRQDLEVKMEAARAEIAKLRAESEVEREGIGLKRDELNIKREELNIKREEVGVKREELKVKRADMAAKRRDAKEK